MIKENLKVLVNAIEYILDNYVMKNITKKVEKEFPTYKKIHDDVGSLKYHLERVVRKFVDFDEAKVMYFLEHGILTDEEHHMQWALVNALKELLGKEGYDAYVKELNEEDYYFDEGIPP